MKSRAQIAFRRVGAAGEHLAKRGLMLALIEKRAILEGSLRVHLVPALGDHRLDALKSEDVQRLKRHLEAKAPKMVNNVLG